MTYAADVYFRHLPGEPAALSSTFSKPKPILSLSCPSQEARHGMASLAEPFKRGMRSLAGGVSIVTTTVDSRPVGLVATSVTSLSVDPPSLLVCVSRSSRSHGGFKETGAFCVNLLKHDDEDMARRFGDPAMRTERFVSNRWSTLSTGAPVLEGAIANLDCRLVRQFDHASHSIFIGEVEEMRLGRETDPVPLIYLNGRYTT